MDVFVIARILRAQWRVVVPVLLLTVGLAYVMPSRTSSEYEARGFLVLEAPAVDVAMVEAMDPVRNAQDLELDGDTTGRNVTVSSLDESNFVVSASAPGSDRAEADAEDVITRLASTLLEVQEQAGVDVADRVELRQVDPVIVAEQQPDGSWVASATVSLNDPSMATTNPYLPNGSTGRLLQVAFQGDVAQEEFAERMGGQITAEVGQQSRDSAPVLQVLTTGSDAQAVVEGFSVATDIMAEDLARRQARANVRPPDQITLAVLAAPLSVADESPPVQRGVVGVVVLGGLLALGLALGMEVIKRRRNTATTYLRDLMSRQTPPPPGDDDAPVPSAKPDGVRVNVAQASPQDPVGHSTAMSDVPPAPDGRLRRTGRVDGDVGGPNGNRVGGDRS